MIKNIKVNCTSVEYIPEEKHLEVESYGSKDERISIEDGIMEIPVENATPEIDIPNLSEEQIHHIYDKLQARVTPHAMRIKSMRKSNEIESR